MPNVRAASTPIWPTRYNADPKPVVWTRRSDRRAAEVVDPEFIAEQR